jgi:hypothetical protein
MMKEIYESRKGMNYCFRNWIEWKNVQVKYPDCDRSLGLLALAGSVPEWMPILD